MENKQIETILTALDFARQKVSAADYPGTHEQQYELRRERLTDIDDARQAVIAMRGGGC